MLRRHWFGFRTLLMFTDGLLAVGLLVELSAVRFGPGWLDVWKPLLDQPAVFAVGYAAAWVGVLWYHGLYRPRARWTIRSEGLAIARAAVVMALITGTVLFAIKMPDVSRLFLVVLFPSQWALTLATRVALRIGFEWLRARGLNTRYVLVVGAGPRAQAFAAKLEAHRELGLRIAGFVDDEPHGLPAHWRFLGGLSEVEALLHSAVIDEVAIVLPLSRWEETNAIAHLCEEEGRIVRVPIDLLDRAFAAGRVEDLDGTPVYSLVSGPDRVAAFVVKRAFDVVVASLALIVASPFLLLVALWIRASDGAPVLFRQTRVGLHGRRFTLLKFRTMVPDAEARQDELAHRSEVAGAAFKMTDDPRVTRTGRFLRRTSMDELPQLWNVIRGNMSLVGPRPALPKEVDDYDLWHRRRLSMKPGMTGLWQVSARRSSNFDNWAQLDLSYIDRWSLWLDLKILARTVPAALEGR
ncbi:MAG TPA: sugar transferase [Candidatus Limnocylindrales bacterium]|nr:sugar transferase [Candidatus Limnocylindrales bacterium]